MRGRLWVLLVALVLGAPLGSGSALAQAAATATATGAWAPAPVADHELLIADLRARLAGLSTRVGLVTDQVDLLQETALGADVSETRAIIVHRNELEGFTLERARYLLDGGLLMDKADTNGALASIEELVLFDGKIPAGEHVLEVEVVCRGGGFGVFSYVEAYRFRLRSRYVLQVREGRINRLDVALYRKPDITLEPAERLGVDYRFEVVESAPAAGEGDR